ncbi:MAG: hypothetical protein ETSY1_30455 [Candidatus Entotheonella factor]|uniref:DNA alkylation repair protein n=1 Tax=Entotheonella factor TaxID=1429438 RepID=W4LC27_ENTF1|nr:DNA alkylation repair protein [Candidatus Entotheonella palauensis]ETW95469.1 MAG: hypothetical protein ETSY1_30455 [Candidatus Entotheonella factor]
MNLVEAFIRDLSGYRDPVQAERAKTYNKSAREHWGIRAPRLDAVIKPYVRAHDVPALLRLSHDLWQTDVFDLMIVAGRILAQKKIPASADLWRLLTAYLDDVDGWALEDQLYHAAWKCLLQTPALLDEIETWTVHENMWMRRAALVYTLPYAKPGYDPERMLTWMGTYASDPEWFIQKAIGWWLRELGTHNPQRVVAFLNAYGDHLKGVAWKEATRKLDQTWRMRS